MMVRANAGSAARAHVTRASAIRAHAQRLPLAVCFVLFFACLFFSNVAYADDSWSKVLWSSNFNDGTQWIVAASNKYDAAAYICGKTPADVSRWTLEQRNKLSNQGGSFQWLAENLSKVWPAWNEETLKKSLQGAFDDSTWSAMTKVYSLLPNGGVSFDPNALSDFTITDWQVNCTNDIYAGGFAPSVIQSARSDLDTILNGGTLGGGYGGLQEEGNYYVFHGDPKWYSGSSSSTSRTYWLWDASTQAKYTCSYASLSQEYLAIPKGLRLLLPKSMISSDFLAKYDPSNYTYALQFNQDRAWTSSNLTPSCKVTIYVFTSENISFEETSNQPYSDSSYLTTVAKGTGKLAYNQVSTTMSYSYQANTITISSNNVFSHTSQLSDYDATSTGLPKTSTGLSYMLMVSKSDGNSGGGDDPDPWPTPVPPEQPNVPEPPVVNPPPITGPVFPTDPPQDPTITPEPEPTGTDYTVYLKAIIRQLNKVIEQMGNHCKHIRDQISTSANAIISNMHTFIADMQESIDSNFAALNDYLEDLTTWYEDFTQRIADGIQDEFSTVESILRQILRKMGVGRGTQKDVEKDVDDDFNFLEWLINFITSKLSGVIGDFVGDVGGLISGVKDKFPFSIPWDIAAILALLDGVPTTPVFTITIPAINGWWQETRFVIDLHPFDSVASAARIMINAWWVLVLVMKTNWLLMIMGDSTSIGERIANRMTGGE